MKIKTEPSGEPFLMCPLTPLITTTGQALHKV